MGPAGGSGLLGAGLQGYHRALIQPELCLLPEPQNVKNLHTELQLAWLPADLTTMVSCCMDYIVH